LENIWAKGKHSDQKENFQTGSETIRRNRKFPNELENNRVRRMENTPTKKKIFKRIEKQSGENEKFQTNWKTFGRE
jgi:hypothetical protein